jgi:hypothetical protein
MAKTLKEILKDKKLEGVKSSTITPGSLGKDPGVDYDPKSEGDRKFVAKHSIEKHEDRVGNGPDVYNGAKTKYSLETPQMKNLGHKKGEDKKVYGESVMSCNKTPQGTSCPMHGMKECAGYSSMGKKTLKEVLGKSAPPKEWIDDFIHSDNPKFAGKSPEKRKEMALAAYYAKQRNEHVDDTADHTQDEIEMVRAELKAITNKTAHILLSMPNNLHVEPWVQAKIAQAKEMINSVHDYMVYGDHNKPEEDEQAPSDGGISSVSMAPNSYGAPSSQFGDGRI